MPKPIQFLNHTKSAIPSLLRKHSKLSPFHIRQIEAASHVYPFRANNYVVENLIDWNNVPNDPIFKLTFPQPEMLKDADMSRIMSLLNAVDHNPQNGDRELMRHEAISIRRQLNPHPAKQKEMNVPTHNGARLPGAQHKYRETLLFFPSEAQWCHAYCTYCFRWAQFTEVGSEQQFKSKDVSQLTSYIAANKQLTDILFTGGDPAVMRTKLWAKYLEPLIAEENKDALQHLNTIRIGTKSLTYWPYRYTHNEDADALLSLLERCNAAGKHITIQAHFTHPQELCTPQVEDAIRRLRMAGCNIRAQAPIVRGINDAASIWEQLWKKEVSLGVIPYYMFIERDTGPKHYFELPLIEAYNIFKEAISRVSGIARTVRGPSMSCEAGKVAVLGVINDMMILQFLQARNPEWMKNPFLAKLDATATWLDDLKPYGGGDEFFYQQELNQMFYAGMSSGQMTDPLVVPVPAQSQSPKLIKTKINGALNGLNGVNGVNGVHKKKENNKVLIVNENEKEQRMHKN